MRTAFILLIGQAGIGKWQVPEYDEALDKWVKSGGTFPLIVRAARRADSARPAVSAPTALDHHARSGFGKDHRAHIRAAPPEAAASPGELWRYTSPYRGLEAMEEKDSDYFFGRAQETVEVLNALAAPDRLPVLIGNSGVGKSSLAQAGVLAALKRQAWPEDTGAPNGWPAGLSEQPAMVLSVA